MQERVVATARRHGMRITGPNALGSISPPDRFFGTFSSLLATAQPQPGKVGIATQSGAYGSHIYAAATLRGIGISRAIATGNEADIDVATCIDYLAEDPGTTVICASLEGCKDGGRLRRALLKAAAARKPVIIMKVGSTDVRVRPRPRRIPAGSPERTASSARCSANAAPCVPPRSRR